MKIFQLFVLILFVFISRNTNAGILFEPVFGLNAIDIQVDLPGSSKEQGSGISWGGRLGYHKFGLQVGLDYLRSTNSYGEEIVSDEYAAFVGYRFPVLFKLYAGYIFAASAETRMSTQDLKLNKGTGSKVGIGFTGLPFLDINFEYRSGTFTEFEYPLIPKDIETNFNTYMLSVSLPLVF